MCSKQHYDDLDRKVAEIANDIQKSRGEVSSLRHDANVSILKFSGELKDVKDGLKDLHDSTDGIAEAWKAGTGFLKFVKWVGSIIGLWIIFHDWVEHAGKGFIFFADLDVPGLRRPHEVRPAAPEL